jgi:maltose alpha-D-glucosyltransferase / alpha-amylase
MWYKNAVIYSLDVETFMDGNGDGIGDFQGLIDRVDHFESLGVTCVWLQPFFPSPNRDDGYDITDYYGVEPRFGTLGDFTAFSQQLAERGIRLLLDLVVNHTSDEHPWFREACRDPQSPYRDYYVWSEEKPADAHEGMVFPGVQETTWTWNEEAGAYYFHRFFAHQPDLNIANPAVRDEILKVMGFWLKLGAAGFRIDAAPFLIELQDSENGGEGERQDRALYEFLQVMHDFMTWRCGDAILLAEANVAAEKVADYFGNGERMHVLFNFLLNQRLFLALARKTAEPLVHGLAELPRVAEGHWAEFLRTHDELDLGRLSDGERKEVFGAFGPEPRMQIYGRGIRRRLAPMLEGDRRRIEMVHSLVCSLPGSQVFRYGDEIGMGDDLALDERLSVRTPMQWSLARNAGFSKADPDRLIRPLVKDGPFGYRMINVESQLADPNSLFNRTQRLIRVRRSCPEIGNGHTVATDVGAPAILALHACWRERSIVTLHNLSEEPCQARLSGDLSRSRLVDITADRAYPPPEGGMVELAGYGYRWLRVELVER